MVELETKYITIKAMQNWQELAVLNSFCKLEWVTPKTQKCVSKKLWKSAVWDSSICDADARENTKKSSVATQLHSAATHWYQMLDCWF